MKQEINMENAQAIRIVALIIIDSFRENARSIMLNPVGRGDDRTMRVSYLINDEWIAYDKIPSYLITDVLDRIKIMANMTDKDRIGFINIPGMGENINLKVKIVPTPSGDSFLLDYVTEESEKNESKEIKEEKRFKAGCSSILTQKQNIKSKDELGNRMKSYESVESQRRLMPLLPVCIRLDGKCFSIFTKGLKRPYDERMSQLMVEVTKALVKETNALIGYTQSDEISLVLYSDSAKSQIYYDGRIQKMIGDLAAFATGVFNRLLPKYIPEKVSEDPLKFPRFDCRVWNVPNKTEAANVILCREQDASKNSVSMAAQTIYSHKQLDGKSGSEKQEMLFSKKINWNNYPAFFKRGTFVRRRIISTKYTAEDLELLPPKHEARKNPNLIVERSIIEVMEMPSFSSVINRVEVIFNGEDPKTEREFK